MQSLFRKDVSFSHIHVHRIREIYTMITKHIDYKVNHQRVCDKEWSMSLFCTSIHIRRIVFLYSKTITASVIFTRCGRLFKYMLILITYCVRLLLLSPLLLKIHTISLFYFFV